MDKCFYNYVFVPNSLSQRYCLDYFRIILGNFRHYRELYEDRYDFDTQYVNDYWANAIDNMIYLSLEQTENTEIIKENIINTLKNEQVIHWFANRTPISDFHKTTLEFINDDKYENALNEYIKEFNKNNIAKKSKNKIKKLKTAILKRIKKLLHKG